MCVCVCVCEGGGREREGEEGGRGEEKREAITRVSTMGYS